MEPCSGKGRAYASVKRYPKQNRTLLYLSPTTNFRLFQIQKKFAEYNFKVDENGRKIFKRIENTVGKGEIARYEQFLLFPQCFQKTFTADTSKTVLVWERVEEL